MKPITPRRICIPPCEAWHSLALRFASTAERTFKRTWIAIGLGLHTTLWILMNIGIFTTGLLAMYACWVNPRLLQRLPATRWWRALRFVPEAASPAGAQPDEPASAPPPAAPQGA